MKVRALLVCSKVVQITLRLWVRLGAVNNIGTAISISKLGTSELVGRFSGDQEQDSQSSNFLAARVTNSVSRT